MIKILSQGVGTFSTPGKPNSDNLFFDFFDTPAPSPSPPRPGWSEAGYPESADSGLRPWRGAGLRLGPDPGIRNLQLLDTYV